MPRAPFAPQAQPTVANLLKRLGDIPADRVLLVPTRRPTSPSPADPSPAVDLAVEVFRKGNRKAEMRRKVREYSEAGVRLVWLVDPGSRTVVVDSAPEQASRPDEDRALDGATVLPGFASPLRELFEQARRGPNDCAAGEKD